MDCVLTHPAGRFFIFARVKRVLAGPTEQCKAMIERSAFFVASTRTSPLSSFALKSAKQNEQQPTGGRKYMEWRIKCPWCDQEHVVDSSMIGHIVKCKGCDKIFKAGKTTVVSPPPRPTPYFFDFQKTKTNTVPSNKNNNQKNTFVPSDSIGAPSENYHRYNRNWNWINDFFDFRTIVIPTFVKVSFFLLFISGSISILVYPFNGLGEKVDTNKIGQIMLFVLFYFVLVVVVIPLWAIVLHALFELTMIPFLILDTLYEIRNKLNQTTKC